MRLYYHNISRNLTVHAQKTTQTLAVHTAHPCNLPIIYTNIGTHTVQVLHLSIPSSLEELRPGSPPSPPIVTCHGNAVDDAVLLPCRNEQKYCLSPLSLSLYLSPPPPSLFLFLSKAWMISYIHTHHTPCDAHTYTCTYMHTQIHRHRHTPHILRHKLVYIEKFEKTCV